MAAVGIERFGGLGELRLMTLGVPEPKPDEVLVRIAAASINPVDWKMREKGYDGHFRFPVVLGRDFAGVVVARGRWVRQLDVGDRVFAFGRKPDFSRGTHADYVAMPAGWVARTPEALDDVAAAAMPLVALTAYQALRALVLAPGETILIHGGAAGVGACAVQLASLLGARVLTTARAAAAARCTSFGADAVIDHTQEDFAAAAVRLVPAGVDAVLDTVGGDTQSRSAAVLRDGGRLATVLQVGAIEPFKQRGIRAERSWAQGSAGDLALLGGLAADGRLRVNVADVLPLEQAAEAYRRAEAGGAGGKLVLRMAHHG